MPGAACDDTEKDYHANAGPDRGANGTLITGWWTQTRLHPQPRRHETAGGGTEGGRERAECGGGQQRERKRALADGRSPGEHSDEGERHKLPRSIGWVNGPIREGRKDRDATAFLSLARTAFHAPGFAASTSEAARATRITTVPTRADEQVSLAPFDLRDGPREKAGPFR
jgi:hypothetical protein